MNPRHSCFFALILGAISVACPAQSIPVAPVAPAAVSADFYRNEAIVFEKSETTYRMRADGTGERDVHIVARIQSQGAAQQFGVLAFSYASAYETPTIKLVRVHKSDGSVIDTPATDAIEMPADVSRQAPLYSDLKEKHIPVRSLSPGDTLEYEVDTSIDKPEAPGQFWGADHFTAPGTVIVLSEVLRLEFPADKYVQVWSPNHKPMIDERNGLRTYTWNVAQLVTAPKSAGHDGVKPNLPKDPDEDADSRKLPSVAWTTFHSWDEVGAWYRSLASKRAEPTDAIRARANELTLAAKTPEDQIRALYGYVSAHTRYIGIDFGIGRYEPHTAADVLANQYGDCKDKDTLLEALLRAKGFSTAPALIGAGIAPVPDVPSPAVFNHVITTVNLPGGRIWLDSTPQAAPYRYLSALLRDTKALVVAQDGPAALVSTPASPPWSFTAHFEANAILDTEGKLTGNIAATYHDDDEVLVRVLAQNVAPAEWDKASQLISAATGFGGTTSNTEFSNAADAAQPIAVSYHYERHPYGDWDNRRIVPLLPMPEFSALDTDASAPQEDIQLGAIRTLTAVSHIKLPDGYRTDLPDPVHVKTDFATFDKTYRFDGRTLTVERTISILKTKVPKDDWKKYQAFTKDIGLSGEPWITLLPPSPKLAAMDTSTRPSLNGKPVDTKSVKESKTVTIPVKNLPKPAPSAEPTSAAATSEGSATAGDLLRTAWERLRSGDLEGARESLDKAKAKDPTEENLWSTYGAIAATEHDYDDAVADFRKELAGHPDNVTAVMAMAQAQSQNSDSVGARATLQDFLTAHPDNQHVAQFLAALQEHAEDYKAALRTLEPIAAQHPDDRSIRLQQADVLVRMSRNDEAAAAAASVLDGADDPDVLNNAAYLLSETGQNLSVAEDASRRSIAKLEAESAGITADQANSRAFAQANLLVASWDTLGWILFKEGKLDEAKPLLSAAWHASLRAEVGSHLAQLYEAMGNKNDALSTWNFASAALGKDDSPEVRQQIHEGIRRLSSAAQSPAKSNLQDLRTWTISRPAGVSGWGTYRLEITSTGVIEARQMTGEKGITGVDPEIGAMKFPELIPSGSKAHLLRSAVVSCSMGKTCQVVLVPDGGLQTEAAQ
ncbi:MAG TPA: DUF3857 domain-containing protein [Acidobacteriaceae bacterium]|nr:DUF3857 domain-containing protein [Acidobacteriaceae bacterium]